MARPRAQAAPSKPAPANIRSLRRGGTLTPAPLVADSIAAIEAAIGGRTALIAALAQAPATSDLTFVLGLIADPLRARDSLAELCAQGGVTPGELIAAYKQGELNRAQALAIHRVGVHLDAVAADTMRRALPQEITCPVCAGAGTFTPEPTKKVPNPDPMPCRACHATGIQVQEGDLEHKKLALDMGKLLPKSSGTQVNVNQQVGILNGSAGGALERMQAATDAILYGDLPDLAQAAPAHVPSYPVLGPGDAPVVVEGIAIPSADPDTSIEEDWQGDPLEGDADPLDEASQP